MSNELPVQPEPRGRWRRKVNSISSESLAANRQDWGENDSIRIWTKGAARQTKPCLSSPQVAAQPGWENKPHNSVGWKKKKPGEIRRSGHHRGWGVFRDADGWVDGGVALEVTPPRWDGPPASGGTGWDWRSPHRPVCLPVCVTDACLVSHKHDENKMQVSRF